MAPWPETGNEPKAPDKTDKNEEVDDTTTATNLTESSENTVSAKSDQKQPDEKEVLTLDEGQLKALLDEAITYKNPKDREGKSELFKELLQEAEADESDSKGLGGSLSGKLPRAYYNLPVRRRQSRHGGQSRECNVGVSSTRGGSLQNLHALGMEGGRRSRRRDTLVSARQREGGSLPTNVNVDNDPDLDIICPNYTSRATLEVSGPNKEDRPQDESNNPTFLKMQGHHHLNGTELPATKDDDPRVIETVYASSISVGPVESGAMLYPSTPVQHVSVLSIPPSQIHAGSDANTRMAFGNSADGKTKPVDENGNALACVRMDSNCLDRKKQRRVKAKNDRNTILSDEIEGFRGGADIDTLMEYIESPSLESKSTKTRTNQANGTRNSVKVRAKEEEPRSLKRRKDKFQRCNSLEEISKTKLEDLTEESSSERVNGSSHHLTKKQVTLDDTELGKKSTWGDDVQTTKAHEHKAQKQERISPEPVQDSEFHVVTKKQRKKKRRAGCGSRGGSKPDYYSGREGGSGRLLYQYRRDQGTSQPRRKSASSVPPSDKSDSSDLDSVHSLPVSSTTVRTRIGQNSVSGGSTPQASYADIARTVASPPDGSQVNIYRQERCSANNTSFTESYERTTLTNTMLPLASFKKDAMTDTNCDKSPLLMSEEYPPLDIKTLDFCVDTTKRSRSDARDTSVPIEIVTFKPISDPVIQARESGDGPRSLPIDIMCIKTTESNGNRRPPVILMNEPTTNTRVPELKFGFEVNYQLLQSDEIPCNETVTPDSTVALPTTPAPVVKDQGAYSQLQDPSLVQFLSSAWEDVLEKVKAGKAVYYDEQ